MQKTKDFN